MLTTEDIRSTTDSLSRTLAQVADGDLTVGPAQEYYLRGAHDALAILISKDAGSVMSS